MAPQMSLEENHLEKVYEQYWLHARHQEYQRLTFSSFFSVLIGGSLAFLSSQYSDPQSRVFVSISMFVLSFLGFDLMHTWRIPFLVFTRLAESILIEWNLERYKRFDVHGKLFSTSFIFHLFYMLMTSLFLSLSVIYLSSYPGLSFPNIGIQASGVATIAFVVCFLSLCVVYAFVLRPVENRAREKAKESLKSVKK